VTNGGVANEQRLAVGVIRVRSVRRAVPVEQRLQSAGDGHGLLVRRPLECVEIRAVVVGRPQRMLAVGRERAPRGVRLDDPPPVVDHRDPSR
jgi:hypothetical protein